MFITNTIHKNSQKFKMVPVHTNSTIFFPYLGDCFCNLRFKTLGLNYWLC